MYRQETDLIKVIMATILGFILLFCLVFYGCASPLRKACNELSKATDKLSQAILIAKTAQEKDPNLVTQKNIEDLIHLRDSVKYVTDVTCGFGELLPDK